MFKKEWTVAWGLEIKYLEKYFTKNLFEMLSVVTTKGFCVDKAILYFV